MSRSEEIAEFVEDSGGIASAAQIAKAGFLPGSISYALESGAIDILNMRSFESRASKLVFSTCPTRLTISMARSPISAALCARARLKAP